MTKLTHSARIILRSRLRRHKDGLLVLQHMQGTYGVSSVSALRNPHTIETARAFGLDVPTTAQVAAYDAAKAGGQPGDDALAEADRVATVEGVDLSMLVPLGSNPPGVSPDPDDADTDDEADDDDGAEGNEAGDPADTVATPADADPVALAAQHDVDDAFKAFAAGDVAGFRARIVDLATRANRPPPAPVQVYAGKIPEGAAKCIGHKNMVEAGLPAPLAGKVEATRLAVYDAPNAPRIDPNYIWPDMTVAALAQFRRGRNVFLTGPAGTGKTSFAQQIAARWGREFVRISCDDQTEAAMLVGMTVPDKDGGARWQDGQLSAAIRRPGTVILVDEPSVARPGALFVLQAVLDDDRRIHVAETGEVIPVAPDVLFVLADNTNGTGDITGAYEATRRLNRATLDRLGVTIRFDYMDANAEAKALAARTGCDRKLAIALAKFAKLTREGADKGKISHPIGLRRLVALAENMADGIPPAQAFQIAVVETAPFDDQEPLRQMWTADFKPVAP